MSWIKRNLYFVIGGGITILLLGLAGWYLYSKWDLNNKKGDSLREAYENLKKLNSQNPHPGSGQIDNIRAAKEFRTNCLDLITKSRPSFAKIPPIPDLPKIGDRDFVSALART